MTANGDCNTAWSAITTAQATILPLATSAANAAIAQNLRGAQTALLTALGYLQDAQVTTKGV